METKPFPSGLRENTVTITRVADRQWHALDHAATALFGGVGARPVSSNAELVR